MWVDGICGTTLQRVRQVEWLKGKGGGVLAGHGQIDGGLQIDNSEVVSDKREECGEG